MDLRNKSDLLSGIFVAVFGLYVIVASSRLAYVSEYGPGPGFLPLWLGIGLVTLALCLIASNLLLPASKSLGQPESWTILGRVFAGWLALMVTILLLRWIGFAVSLALLTIFLIVGLEGRPRWTAVGIALALAVGFQLIFVFALGLSLPSGPWRF
jgi:putative tricarboxylic transport membrane protein